MQNLSFLKMHGAGNDFIILDWRRHARLKMTSKLARRLADRRTGIGCDQVIVVGPARKSGDAYMRIYNADGGEVASCGNATRCVAWLLMEEAGAKIAAVETQAGVLVCALAGDGQVTVDMGAPRLEWRDIPLSIKRDTLHLNIGVGELRDPVGVGMGNPHAVFFVKNGAKADLGTLGPKLERHALFPKRANIGVAQIVSKGKLKLRVWERGAGETRACGTGACAAAVAAHRRGLTGRKVQVDLPGGRLLIDWQKDEKGKPGHVYMTGPVALSFSGMVTV